MAPQAITPLLVYFSLNSFEKRPILTSQGASPLISPPKREQNSRFEGYSGTEPAESNFLHLL
jgi:hypothetical protein